MAPTLPQKIHNMVKGERALSSGTHMDYVQSLVQSVFISSVSLGFILKIILTTLAAFQCEDNLE